MWISSLYLPVFGILIYMKSLSLSQPHLLVTVGIPGSGKTTFAAKFASTFSAPYVNYDTIMTVARHDSASSDAFAGYMLKQLFKTDHTVVFDGPTASKAERAALKNLAASAGYKTVFIWVQTDPTTAESRFTKSRQKSGRHGSKSQFDSMVKHFEAPVEKEGQFVVISGKHTYATQVKAVLKNLLATKQAARAASTEKSTSVISASGKRTISVR